MPQQSAGMSQDHTSPASTASAGTSSASVLVVDDDLTMCTFCEKALSQVGYTVYTATEVEAALATLRGPQPIDLLLADIQMPGISGLDLAQIAREIDPAIAIIIITGHATLDAIHQTARRGVADFLTKPFELDELQQAVDQALSKRQLLQEQVRLRSLEKILHSSEAINAILDRDQLGQVIVEQVCIDMPGEAAFLLLADEPEQVVGWPQAARLLPAGHAMLHATLDSNSVATHPADVQLSQLDDRMISSGVTVPMRARGQVIGALLLCGERPDLFISSTRDALALLANQAGTALWNAQLYGKLESAYRALAELDRLKSEFLAIASHELRSPLTITLGYTKILRDRGAEEQREFAQRALDSAEQIKAIVDTMVRLHDIELKQLRLSSEPCSLADLIYQAVERLTPQAERRRQQIEVVISQEVTLPVDREMLLLVLGNLIDNAIKFSPNESVIKVGLIRWHRAQLLAAANAAVPNPTTRDLEPFKSLEWAVIRVADPGAGISREQQLRIFERFYQVAGSLTRSQGGIGLGLALVADLMILQGGFVWLESVEEQGSIFSVALPCA
jgi:signal transduction histidine kinase